MRLSLKFAVVELQKHNEGQHFVVLESGRLAYVSLPQEYAASIENEDLCFTDHRPKDVSNEMCCPKESAHVHAHVHDGEFTKDILLEQVPCSDRCRALYRVVYCTYVI